jgi:hypothetical protein
MTLIIPALSYRGVDKRLHGRTVHPAISRRSVEQNMRAPHVGRLSASHAVAYGGLVVGVLDLLDAFIFFGLRGVRPVRILQSIAAGLVGRAAFQGGTATALLGVCLHFLIASTIVLTFFVASRRFPVLTRHAVASGMIYGLLVYAVMNQIVVPLSAAGSGPFSWPVLVNGLAIHAFGVGLPSALFARAAGPPPAHEAV